MVKKLFGELPLQSPTDHPLTLNIFYLKHRPPGKQQPVSCVFAKVTDVTKSKSDLFRGRGLSDSLQSVVDFKLREHRYIEQVVST